MQLYYPSYYQQFRCIAGSCTDSCCHQWQVQVDDLSAQTYLQLPGALGDALRTALKEEEGQWYMENVEDRCPMWQKDGLCRIQTELGEAALCEVCRAFPRLRQDYGDFVELGLEMSCPEAARIMLTCDGWNLVAQEASGGEEPDYDPQIMELLRSARPYALRLLEDRRKSVRQRLTVLLMYSYHVQAAIDGGELLPFDPEAALAEAQGFAEEQPELGLLLEFYQGLEILTEQWRTLLRSDPQFAPWDEMLCKLAAYGVYRYWYQAVSDWDLAARVKLILLHCIMSRLWGGASGDGLMRTIQLYSKEIENNIDNVEAILDAAYTHPALTDKNLLGLLLADQ